MRKLLAVLCLFILCGCSSVTKIEEDDFVHYEIASDLPNLYGGGYRFVETWNGFKIEEIAGNGNDLKGNEIFKNDDFAIENKYVNSFGDQYTYYYNDGEKTSELYTGMLNQKIDIFPHTVTIFEMDDNVYFTYYDIYDLVVNLVEDGKLVEYKRIPIEENGYRLKAFISNDYEMYYRSIHENETKYVCYEREYTFKNTDRVTVLKDYIFYSTYENDQVSGTYIINRKTNETIQVNENIDLVLDDYFDHYPKIYNQRFINNSFVFIEKIDDKTIYSYGSIVDDTFKKVSLPYDYSEYDNFSLYDEKTIFLTKEDYGYNDFYVIEIKGIAPSSVDTHFGGVK